MVAHCSDMQDLSRRTIPRHLTGHHTTIISSPLLLLINILHWTHHSIALSIPTLSLLHTCTSIVTPEAEKPNGTLHYHYILAITPTHRYITLNSSSHRPINTAYIHLCQSMQYRDAYRTPHCYYILLLLPYLSTQHAGLININTEGLVTAYMHQYHNTGPAPSQRQALGHDTDCPVMVILAHCSICTARRRHLWFHLATTS
jgi:hypothetical protein